ncbi:MAG: PIN domain-containing protein [Candidatus Diapherotrites archaeon]|nr:PIN domain-containing protein [Candidatus Diapherotrites archaeon]
MELFFADSYAIIEYFKGNKSYLKYFEKNKIVTARLNLMEVYYSALVNSTEENAEKYYDALISQCVEVSDSTIKKALKFRYKNKEKKLSYADSISYLLSIEMEIKFLTGDKEFKQMKNVEFVK